MNAAAQQVTATISTLGERLVPIDEASQQILNAARPLIDVLTEAHGAESVIGQNAYDGAPAPRRGRVFPNGDIQTMTEDEVRAMHGAAICGSEYAQMGGVVWRCSRIQGHDGDHLTTRAGGHHWGNLGAQVDWLNMLDDGSRCAHMYHGERCVWGVDHEGMHEASGGGDRWTSRDSWSSRDAGDNSGDNLASTTTTTGEQS